MNYFVNSDKWPSNRKTAFVKKKWIFSTKCCNQPLYLPKEFQTAPRPQLHVSYGQMSLIYHVSKCHLLSHAYCTPFLHLNCQSFTLTWTPSNQFAHFFVWQKWSIFAHSLFTYGISFNIHQKPLLWIKNIMNTFNI